MSDLTDIDGIGDDTAERLRSGGFESIEAIATADSSDLTDVKGFGEQRVESLQSNARDLVDDEESEGEDDGSNRVHVDLDLSDTQYDHTVAALIDEEVAMRRRNRSDTVSNIRDIRRQLDESDSMDLTLNQLGIFYRALTRRVDEYQSDNVGDITDDLADVRDAIREIRVDHWPK